MRFLSRFTTARAVALEAAAVAAVYVSYSALRVIVEGNQAAAVEHAFNVAAFERSLGIFHEQWVHETVQSQPWLAAIMKGVYLWVYFPLLIFAAAFMFARDRGVYRAYRNAFFGSMAIGLVIFALLPVAPPRMLPELGFFDPIHSTVGTSSTKNEFAAVPSFHFGFTLLASMGIAHVLGWHRWWTAALALVPAVMLLSIVSTANHFFLDAAIGGLVVLSMWWFFVGSMLRGETSIDDAVPREAPLV